MKKLFSPTLLAAAICLLAFKNSTNPLYVSGKLMRAVNDKKERVFEIIVKGDNVIVAKANTKKTGEFDLSFTPHDEKYFDFFYLDPNHKADTIFLKSYTSFESDELKVTFQTTRKRHVDDDDNVVCPKCGKSESVTAAGNNAYYTCSKDGIKF